MSLKRHRAYLNIACVCWLALLMISHAHARSAVEIDAIIRDEMRRQNIPGMAVAIVEDGRIRYAMGYGDDDLRGTAPVTTETVFRWGSISKTLTATAVLMLAEEKPRFSLNDRVTAYVDYWPAEGNKGDIRISHLLSHRSGTVHYRTKQGCFDNPSPDYSLDHYKSRHFNARRAVVNFSHQDLCFDPGTGFKYSTFGYTLLGSVIEAISGRRYADWIDGNIRQPLGMRSLRQATGIRTGYRKKHGRLLKVTDGNVSWRLPGGGWESNIIDLAKFAKALIEGRLMNNTARLWSHVTGNRDYGYGMIRARNSNHVWHAGNHINSSALLYLLPHSRNGLGIVLFSNASYCRPGPIVRRLLGLYR